MQKFFLLIAATYGFLAVALGAFGAHALKDTLSEAALATWQTAVQYHFYHAFALFGVALYMRSNASALLNYSGFAFCLGLILFCASLYGLALGGPRWLGPITPVGGLLFMVGWGLLFVAVFYE